LGGRYPWSYSSRLTAYHRSLDFVSKTIEVLAYTIEYLAFCRIQSQVAYQTGLGGILAKLFDGRLIILHGGLLRRLKAGRVCPFIEVGRSVGLTRFAKKFVFLCSGSKKRSFLSRGLREERQPVSKR
jgi:hypothetical protein